jgi:hypothetical protein
MALDCYQTYRLHMTLADLHKVSADGLPEGGKKLAVVDPDETTLLDGEPRRTLEALLKSEGEDLWPLLEQLRPGLLQAVALKKQHQERSRMVDFFRKALTNPDHKEDKWQRFFEQQAWVFGHGLDYRFLHRIQAQPHYGGTEVAGTGAVRGDFLMATKARIGFTVLVDIKTPFTQLLGNRQYRNKAWEIGPELAGGVAQVQAQCATWAAEGARQEENREALLKADIHTCEPKGILIIGTTAQVAGDPCKRATFERFRRNLHNPQILTFDELLARAEFMVAEPDHSEQHPLAGE